MGYHLAVARGGIYAGWSHAGRHRVWVRVPAELKRRAEEANGDGPHAGPAWGRLRDVPVAAQAEALAEPFWGRSPLNGTGVDLAGPPIVLVHGIATSSRGMEPLLRELGRRRPAFAPDLPGFGRSDPPLRALDLAGLAESLRRWMLDNHLAPAVLVGTSFGCQVAIELASSHPELAEHLVLLGPTDPAERDRRLYPLKWAASAPRLAPTALRNVIDAGPWQAKRALEQARRDPVEDKLGLIEAPTLIVRGSRDWVTPRSWAKKLAERIPVSRLETIEHAGHMPANGAVGRLAAMIEDFLDGDLARASVASGRERRRTRWIVDGMNVIGTRPDGWWRDRKRAWSRLHHRLEQLAFESGDEVRLVLDGGRPGTWRDNGLVECCFAAGGRNAADDAIVARVEADPRPDTLTVVTSDRELAERVRELGADVVASRRFLDRLEEA